MSGGAAARIAAAIVLAITAGALAVSWPPAANAQPMATVIVPQDGAVLAQPPTVIHMCFASPVNIRDLNKGGDFRFTVQMPAVQMPDGLGLGLRIVFRSDGLGVDIQPGLPQKPPEGEWTFRWRVTDPDTLAPTEGTVKFTVKAGGSPPPAATPAPCGTETVAPAASPAASGEEGDNGPGTVLIALIVAGSVVGALAVGLSLYVVRRRLRAGPPN